MIQISPNFPLINSIHPFTITFLRPLFISYLLFIFPPSSSSIVVSSGRLQGVAVRGRLQCGKLPLEGAKVKIVDLDPRPDRDDLMGESATDQNGQFQVNGATKEEGNIEASGGGSEDIPRLYGWAQTLPEKDCLAHSVQLLQQRHNERVVRSWHCQHGIGVPPGGKGLQALK